MSRGTGRKWGRPPAAPDERRNRTFTVALSAIEEAEIRVRAGSMPIRVFMRHAALDQKVPEREVPSAAAFDLAERLTAIAADLADTVAAIRAGRPVIGFPAHVTGALIDAAHVAGLVIIGARPDAR